MNLVLEIGCLSLTHKLAAADSIHTELGIICRNITRLLRETGNGAWQYAPREGNMAAHLMAHVKTRWTEREVWYDRPPLIIVDQIELDDVAATSG
ncbi:unnamed protein product [Linum tenue]|uniref:RNase H type-1 domain-containing protein n=1 Tax=Linum tenue TaxID=586396 RepID=A0AAV0K5W2_9ROSI|nr:unnamed protein product [Linum tenue]